MRSSKSLIDLHELGLLGGQRTERFVETELEPVLLSGQRYDVFPKDGEVRLLVERVAGGFLVTVFVSASVYGSCFRCLKEVSLDLEASEREFVSVSGEGESEEETSPYIRDFVVDVPGMAREAVIMALPTQVLCDEACRGLCPQCGQNLNEAECECGPPAADPRWGKLEKLKEAEGEPPA